MRDLKAFLPAGLLAVGLVLQLDVQRQHSLPLVAPLRSVPLRLAGYDGSERTMSDAERAVVGVTDYVFRVFGPDSAAAFSLYVGYYGNQTTGKTIHSPRNCLPGAGWEVVESSRATVAAARGPVTVNRYLIANGTSQALVYYWYQGRGRVAYSEYRVKWDLLRDAMRFGRSEEALVRIVVPVPALAGSSTEAWRTAVAHAEATARSAATEVIPEVDRVLPTWKAG